MTGPARGAETIVDGGGIDATVAITFGTSNVTINGFTITDSGFDGNYNGGVYMTADVTGIDIVNNVITNNTEGVAVACAGACSIRTNLITANNTTTGPSYGPGIDAWAGDTDLTISDNEFSLHTQGNPILLEATAANQHTNIAIVRNNFHDNPNSSAIYALGIANGVVSQNQITAPSATCLSLSGGNNTVTVTNNFFSGADRGIRLEDAGYDAYYPGQGLDTNSNIRIYANSFVGFSLVPGTAYAVGNESGYTSPSLDVATNWWGDVTGPTVTGNVGGNGGGIDGSVSFSPWLGDGTDTSANAGFQPNAAPLYYPVDSIRFSTQPANAIINQPLLQQPVVEVLNEIGGRALQFSGAVTVALVSNPGGAALTGDTMENAANGLATFTNLTLDQGGNGYTMSAAVSGLSPIVSAPFVVLVPASITTSPQSTNILFGQTNTFTVVAAGTAPLSYQWYFTNDVTHIVSLLPGQTGASLTLGPVTFASAGGFYVTVSNLLAAPVSAVAQMKVFSPPAILTQPANFKIVAGNNAVFTIVAAGTPPLSYQWNKNGLAITDATNTALAFTNVQEIGTNKYTCTVTNVVGTVTTSTDQGLLVVTSDLARPTITILSPVNNFRRTNGGTFSFGGNSAVAPDFILAGTVADNGLITNVTIQRIFPAIDPPVAATLSGTAPGAKTFTNTVTMVDGTNIFHIWATDSAGNKSTTNSLTGFFSHLSSLTIHLVNGGTGAKTTPFIVPSPEISSTLRATNGAQLVLTRPYGVTAVAGQNTIFSNWTDGNNTVLTNGPSLIFQMSSNLVLNANFATNPIIAAHLQGNYNGLFTNAAGIRVETAGSIANLLVTTNRTYSGLLGLQGKSYTLAGKFDLAGNATNTILHTGGNLTVTMSLDLTGGTKAITGTVVCAAPGSWTSTLLADLATNSLPVANARWTTVIPPTAGAPDQTPGGSGYATITNHNGTLTISGKLADGAAFTQTVPLSKNGTAPLHSALYMAGLLEGMLDFSSGSPVGQITWIKETSTLPTYAQGITNEVQVSGALYHPPATGVPALLLPGNLGTITLDPADHGIGAQADQVLGLYWSIKISSSYLIYTNLGADSVTNKISGSIDPKTGILTFTFRPTGSLVNKTCYGVVDQSAVTVQGAFIGITNTGGLNLQ